MNLELYLKGRRDHPAAPVSTAYPWFDLFFRCPLWGVYLRPTRRNQRAKTLEEGAVWSRQLDCWCRLDRGEPTAKPARELARRNALKIKYMYDFNEPSNSHEFDNMYAVYDSVPVLEVTKPRLFGLRFRRPVPE